MLHIYNVVVSYNLCSSILAKHMHMQACAPTIHSHPPANTHWEVFIPCVILSLFIDICFEGTPLQTSRGPLFSVQGQESDGQLCATAVRDESEVDDEDFESFQYATFVLGAPVFGDGVAAGET